MDGATILVVDDNPQVRDFLADTVLQAEGFNTKVAPGGRDALEIALNDPPDLIITDYSMPDMNGLDLVETLRKAGSRIPVILITAEGSEEIAVRALRLGVMDYFIKPFDPMDLIEAIERVLSATQIGAVRAGVPDQRRLRALNRIIEIGQSSSSLLELDDLLKNVVEAAVDLCDGEIGILWMKDANAPTLSVRASANLRDDLHHMQVSSGESAP
ncbi:MAG: response regulator, partial [Chloroflexi bacterium]|nr:response regulator [Chloroflexota bacterium]